MPPKARSSPSARRTSTRRSRDDDDEASSSPRTRRVAAAAATTTAAAAATAGANEPSASAAGTAARAQLQSLAVPGSGGESRGSSGGAQSRRTSRRASVDPYPRSSPVLSRRASPAAAASGSGASAQPEGQQQRTAEALAPPPSQSVLSYELRVVQQPIVGCEASQDRTVRLPVVPAAVVEVIARDQSSGDKVALDASFLFCACSLRDETGQTPISPQRSSDSEDATELQLSIGSESVLLGRTISDASDVRDLSGDRAAYFVFEDLAVRLPGRFRLDFRLGQVQPGTPRLASVQSEPFDVVAWDRYPGIPPEAISTTLSRHLKDQDVPIYLPPLAAFDHS